MLTKREIEFIQDALFDKRYDAMQARDKLTQEKCDKLIDKLYKLK